MAMGAVLFFGLLTGMRHAFEADHVAAVASLAARSKSTRQTMKLGFYWGAGHTITLFLVGAIALSFGGAIPDSLSHYLELIVGFMLVALGVDVLFRLIRERVHLHVHCHAGGEEHVHAHSHKGETQGHSPNRHKHEHRALTVRSLLVGMMHGMAGSAALIALTLQTVESLSVGVGYILVFGVGSLVGMGLLSIAISLPLIRTDASLTWFYNGFRAVIGSLTIYLGVSVIFEQGAQIGELASLVSALV